MYNTYPLESLYIQEKVVHSGCVKSMEEEWITKMRRGKQVCNCSRMVLYKRINSRPRVHRLCKESCVLGLVQISKNHKRSFLNYISSTLQKQTLLYCPPFVTKGHTSACLGSVQGQTRIPVSILNGHAREV